MALNKKRVFLATAVVAFLILSLIGASSFLNNKPAEKAEILPLIPEPTIKYGVEIDSFNVVEGTIGKNQFLADILLPHNISYPEIDKLARKATDVFDVRKLRVKKKYTILTSRDSLQKAKYFIYDPGPFFYVVYDLQDTMSVTKIERPIDNVKKTGSGVIYTSLWDAIIQNGMPIEIAVAMEDIFGWSVDFYQVRKGDRFKLIYDEQFIEGESVGVAGVSGALFNHNSAEYYGYYFEIPDVNKDGYYFDENARPMKKAFLKSPVKYSRISSPFNRRRFHPILKRVKPHLGTDYAAPRGTPIYSVAAGTVTKASRTRGNGKYVKVKHDRIYSTQYLHMSGFAKGIRAGVHVKQGQVIGYVGSTGLATGPHVCFRFWKNGRQVNHRSLKLPPPEPMAKKYIPQFEVLRDSVKIELDAVAYLSEDEIRALYPDEDIESIPTDSLLAEEHDCDVVP